MYFYKSRAGYPAPPIRRVIERCERAATDGNGIEPQDVDVLKLLYLVRYVDDVKANLDNIVILMADDIRLDKIIMREQVRGSLDRLMSQNYIIYGSSSHFPATHNKVYRKAQQLPARRIPTSAGVQLFPQHPWPR